MRFTLLANAPWCGTGYGQQAGIWAPRWKSLGHEVAIAAVYGCAGARTAWNGIPVYPAGFRVYGADVIAGHALDFGADLVITLLDAWAMDVSPLNEAGIPVAHWMPVDTETLGAPDKAGLEAGGGTPVAMSLHGKRQLEAAGFQPLYAPHGIPCDVFKPGDKAAARERMGIPQDAFVIGINAANKDPVRKGFPEQLDAFRLLHDKHPDALLLMHSSPEPVSGEGVSLAAITHELGIAGAVLWSDPYKYISGGYRAADLAQWWYPALDLYSGCAYGEGFGLPAVEAQACGIPVVVTDCSAMSELCGAGWKVAGQRYWQAGHQKWWKVPFTAEIAAAYEEAYDGKAALLGGQAREFALGYDADRVLTEHWKPVLGQLEALVA